MHEAFGFTIDDYVMFGGYPGAVPCIQDEERWRAYLRDSIMEPSISRDIIQLERISKPALLRQRVLRLFVYSSGRFLRNSDIVEPVLRLKSAYRPDGLLNPISSAIAATGMSVSVRSRFVSSSIFS